MADTGSLKLKLKTSTDKAALTAAAGEVKAAIGDVQAQAAKGGKFRLDTQAAMASLDKLSTRVLQVGAGMAVALGAMAKEAATFADDMAELSQKTGIATDDLQFLKFAAEQSGTSLEGAANATKFLQKNLSEARGGNKETAAAFKQLGIDVNSAAARQGDLSKLLPQLADGMSRVKDQSDKTALAMKTMGRSGTDLLPMLADGKKGIEDFTRAFESVGGAVDTAGFDEFKDQLDAMSFGFKALRVELGGEILMGITGEEGIPAAIKQMREWVTEHGELIRLAVSLGEKFFALALIVKGISFSKRLYDDITRLTNAIGLTQSTAGLQGAGGAKATAANVGAITMAASVVYLTADVLQGWGEGWGAATERMGGGESAESIQKDILSWQGFGEFAGDIATLKWGKAGRMLGEGWRAEFARRGIGRSDEEIADDGRKTASATERTANGVERMVQALERQPSITIGEQVAGWQRSGAGYGR